MKRYIVASLAMGICFAFAFSMEAVSNKRGTRMIKMTPAAKKKKKRVMINFTKHKAAGVKCSSCHRRHKDGKKYMKRCGKCHNTSQKAKNIGHKMCRDCHKTRKRAGQKHGPTKCSGCHKY